MKRTIAFILSLIMALSLAACSTPAPKEQAPAPTETEIEPETPAETPPAPEDIPGEEIPDETPEPETQTEPGPAEPESNVETSLEPITYTGSGNSVIDVDADGKAYVFHITGNAEDRYFGVKAYSADKSHKTTLVNTSDPYEGITVDLKFNTAILEVTATGDWTVELMPLADCPKIASGETLTGTGDEVVIISSFGNTASIKGNDADRYFGVKAYDGNGRSDLMVNTSDPYEGTVMIENDPVLLTVTAVGDWSITFD